MDKATRSAFGEALVEVGERDLSVVVLDADLSKSTMTGGFAKQFPERAFDVGIAEGNMIGIGAGLALSGKTPIICSFGCFLASRFEQIRISVAYTNANVKMVGTHSGLGVGEDGYSQMALEDVGVLRTLPNMTIIQPADEEETKQALFALVQHRGTVYLRLTRQKVPALFDAQYRFEWGKGVVLKEGTDVTLVATGALVHPTLEAEKQLKNRGILATVLNIHTIAPLDTPLILHWAKTTQRIVTLEDHSVVGGLGSAVAEVLSENLPTPLKRIGTHTFGESGTAEELYKKYGFTPEGIATGVLEFLA